MPPVSACCLALTLLLLAPPAAAFPHPIRPPAPHPVEAPHPGEAPGADGTRRNRTAEEIEEEERDPELKKLHETPSSFKIKPGERIRFRNEEYHFLEALKQPPVTIVWRKVLTPDHRIKYDAFRPDPGVPPPGTWLDADTLTGIQKSGISVVHSGDIPSGPIWNTFTAAHTNVAVKLPGSQNDTPDAIKLAAALGVVKLAEIDTRIFNALPQATDPVASAKERTRMGLQRTGTVEDWKNVNEGIKDHTAGMHAEVATRAALLEELQHGTSDVVIVYAHFDGKALHLPGETGSLADHTITVAELAKMNRVGDPTVKQRIIVLAACSTAAPVEGRSLAQVLLKTGIARTVFATDRPYDAREIPALMSRLAQQPVRAAGGQLRQYVDLRLPTFFRPERTFLP